MKALRVYVDTSVLGGCSDPEFERWSTGLIIPLFNAVNIEQGYKALTIYSPQEVTIHGRDQGDQSS